LLTAVICNPLDRPYSAWYRCVKHFHLTDRLDVQVDHLAVVAGVHGQDAVHHDVVLANAGSGRLLSRARSGVGWHTTKWWPLISNKNNGLRGATNAAQAQKN
jgi:hypothetical protein